MPKRVASLWLPTNRSHRFGNRFDIRSSTRRISLDPSGRMMVTMVPSGMDLGAATVTPITGDLPEVVSFPADPQQSAQWQ